VIHADTDSTTADADVVRDIRRARTWSYEWSVASDADDDDTVTRPPSANVVPAVAPNVDHVMPFAEPCNRTTAFVVPANSTWTVNR